ncbi:RraA family protein [Anaeromicropila populeti]|uniref:Regulator of RNase E activity RraA n=1 Tax=Anaeromicropila populeti TaxID=37658 RepID=A0A1I6HVU4_9FIRM|nr:RraA family protein [Anaeromicropila populeti]SFR58547.1 Regulator of RNase E activity RraA [Anaeromicropila populeti]
MKEEIIKYIKRNRVSTTEIADCLGKKGSLYGIHPINRGHFRVGNVFWTYASGESNWNVHDQIRKVQENDIILVDVFQCGNRAILGELVAKYALLYLQAGAIVVNGNVRDVPNIIKENYSVWCKGYNPEGCFNKKDFQDIAAAMYEEYNAKYNGSIAVCDDCGVVIIPKEEHTKEFYEKIVHIEEQEDIWFDCIDRLKWDTFDTVCKKKYMENPGV